MATPPQQPDRAAEPPSIVAAILGAAARSLVAKGGEILDATFLHGPVAAALRQGADEIGAALKAFPDSIQTHEPGSVLNPLYSDIANNRRPEIHGHAEGVPSVAAILAQPQTYLAPEPDHGHGHEHGRGMGM